MAEYIWRTIQGRPGAPSATATWATWPPSGAGPPLPTWARLRIGGFPAWVLWLVVHIFWLIGFDNRVLVFIRWTWSYFTYQRGARLITGPVEGPLRRPPSS